MLSFCFEDTPFTLHHSNELIHWLRSAIEEEHHQLGELTYIFCSDQYLLEVNRTYLQHDYYTDVITFDHSEEVSLIEGDIFISVDRVRENAHSYQVDFWHELHRVMVHGVLHLLGYEDKDESAAREIRQKEDYYLMSAPQAP